MAVESATECAGPETRSRSRTGSLVLASLLLALSLAAAGACGLYVSPEPVRLGAFVVVGPRCNHRSHQREMLRWFVRSYPLHRATRSKWTVGPWTVYQYRS